MTELDRSEGCKHGIAGFCTPCYEEARTVRLEQRIDQLERQLAEAKKALGQMRVIYENREMSTLGVATEMLRVSLEGLKSIDAARKDQSGTCKCPICLTGYEKCQAARKERG